MDRIVLCMKWGNLYGPDYVNVLHSAARTHITGDFRFVCLTDDPTGLDAGIEAFPIPELGLRSEHWRRGGWPKVSVFRSHVRSMDARALFIDLDMVLCGPLDGFFAHGDGLVMLDSGPWRYRTGVPRPMSSIFAFDLHQMEYMVDKLMADSNAMVARYGIEQDFIGGEAEKISYWPREWVCSYKYHLRPPLIIDRFRGPKPPGPDVKVICFHGQPRPMDLIRAPAGNWDVPPHYGRGPVPWMVDYWTRHGGKI